MKVNGTDISMIRGDSEEIRLNFSGYTLTPGEVVEMTVRKNVRSAEKSLYKKITDFQDNVALISIQPQDTSGLAFGDYVYDIQLTYGGRVKTLVPPSTFTLEEEVTYG